MADTSYTFHPADYLRVTVGLSLLEHGAFRLLLDHYYSVDGQIPAEKPRLYKICVATKEEEMRAVDFVVNKYFTEENGLLRNKRADEEIAKKKEYLEKQAMKGKLGGRPIKQRVSKTHDSLSLDNSIKDLKDLKDLIKIYCEKFEKKFGEKATVNWAKDTVLVKRLFKTYSMEKLVGLLSKFFETDDPFILKSGYTIGVFYVSINKLLIHGKMTDTGTLKRERICRKEGCKVYPTSQTSGEWHCYEHSPWLDP